MNYNIVIKDNDLKALEIANKLKDVLNQNNYVYDATSDFVFVVGGDGSLLRAIHNSLDEVKTYFVINAGNLGYHATISSTNLELIPKILAGNDFVKRKIPLFKLEVNNEVFHFVNELRISSKKMLKNVNVKVDELLNSEFNGSGLCVSSQFGSSGYSWYNGGSFIDSNLDSLQLTILGAINNEATKSIFGNYVFSNEREIKISTINNDLYINYDFNEIDIKKDSYKIKISKSNNYFQLCEVDKKMKKLYRGD